MILYFLIATCAAIGFVAKDYRHLSDFDCFSYRLYENDEGFCDCWIGDDDEDYCDFTPSNLKCVDDSDYECWRKTNLRHLLFEKKGHVT